MASPLVAYKLILFKICEACTIHIQAYCYYIYLTVYETLERQRFLKEQKAVSKFEGETSPQTYIYILCLQTPGAGRPALGIE